MAEPQFYEPKFAIVQAVRAGYDEFEVMGVFTRSEDAEAFRDELVAEAHIRDDVSVIQRVPMKTVIDLLVEDKLGAMADAVKMIAEAVGEMRKDAEGYPNG